MKHITVFDRYYPKNVEGFTEPFKSLVVGSLEDLGYEVTYINFYDELALVKDSMILCILPPELIINNFQSIDPSNHVIWWNLEPFDISGLSKDLKLISRRNTVDKIMQDKSKYNVSRVVFFNKNQAELYDGEKDFLPIGYHPTLSYDGKYDEKKKAVVFAGYSSIARGGLMNRVNKKLPGTIVHAGHRTLPNLTRNIQRIYKYKFGLDCPSKWTDKHIHWHRIVMYAANNTVLLSWSDLSPYGINDREHYIRYTSESDIVVKIQEVFDLDRDVVHEIGEKLLDKIKRDFMMKDLFERILYEEEESI